MLMHVWKLLNFWPQLYSKYPGYVVCVWVKSSVKFFFLLSKLYLCLLHGRFPTRENSPPLLRLANVLGADVGNSYNILKPSWRNSCSKPEIYMSVFFFLFDFLEVQPEIRCLWYSGWLQVGFKCVSWQWAVNRVLWDDQITVLQQLKVKDI